MTRKLISYVTCLFTFTHGYALAAEQVVLRGCLKGGPGDLYVATSGTTQPYKLTGNTAALTRYIDKEVSLEGSVSVSPEPSFAVNALKQVFDVPHPTLQASFTDPAFWRHETDATYGITYAHPIAWTRVADSEWSMANSNFAAGDGAVVLGRFQIPTELYAQSNFVGGAFGVFVNPQLTNAQSCAQFGDADPRLRSSRIVGHVEYSAFSAGGAAMGTYYSGRDFHTFQNGLCFQISFTFAEWNTANSDTGCSVPSLQEPEELRIVDSLIGAISFSQPANSVLPNENSAALTPRLIDFEASSETADIATNRGRITFSWKAENTDYVELSYTCFPRPKGAGVAISEENIQRDCENNAIHLYDMRPNHSPYSSAAVLFGNFLQAQPISITVMLTPFSRATPYPAAAKSITVGVVAFNPFLTGVPASNGNVTLTYSPGVDANGSYRQGSALTIQWNDNFSSRDPCVNLYLAHDDGNGGMGYRSRISDACLKPARGGSYKWTIPNTFSGPGYRIFAITPGSSSSGSGPAFAILPATSP